MATAILIDDLYIAYQALAENCLRARRAIVADASYPLVVPNFGLKRTDWTTPAARLAAAESMTRLFFLSEGDVHYKAGILCASPDTVDKFISLGCQSISAKCYIDCL